MTAPHSQMNPAAPKPRPARRNPIATVPHHTRATPTDESQGNPTTAPPHTCPTPHTRGRAPGQSAGRAPFPTNRHEGGSLT